MAVVQNKLANLKVAIVCDWLTSIGGAERVVLALHEIFPNAPIYTSQYDPNQVSWFKDIDVRTTWLQKLPKNNTFRKFLPVLRRIAFQKLDLREYDLVISSSGAEAKSVKKLKSGAIHVCYCHSPTHYYWSRYDEYIKEPGFGKLNPLARLGLKILSKPMRNWDFKVAQRPNYLIANSSHIQNKIKEYYKRDSIVIHPPVEIERFNKVAGTYPKSGFVAGGRQTPYKHFDLIIESCTKLNIPITIFGDGPMHEKLLASAGPSIKFMGELSDNEVPKYLASAVGFIFPVYEDFGIIPVEAMAAGTPVIAYKAGGALDYINPKTGAFFNQQTTRSLSEAINNFIPSQYKKHDLLLEASKFSKEEFISNFKRLLDKICAE